MSIINIGIVIADDEEFSPLLDMADKYKAKISERNSCQIMEFDICGNENTVKVKAVLCGIGKVNAAACTAYLIADGADYIINTGLSGGINGISKGEVTLPTRLVEHDFDLTPLGYDLAVKPGQEYIYSADKKLNEFFLSCYPQIKQGVMVCGDCFVSSDEKKKLLIEKFDAMSCDMESAAIASVCHFAGVGFTAVRRVSDDGGENASADYRSNVKNITGALIEIVLNCIEKMPFHDELFLK